ncbi:hypothetical protein MRB53_031527 [Persea americana]|uniref:Uncharacterized protein n=1 Tax=Persea americana TaxID=3435 RepID=A0ACC2KPK7_PERAE|nr:hypothetical protein MRB53_031527 [Persea americana]
MLCKELRMKKAFALVILFFLVSSSIMEGVHSDVTSHSDSCTDHCIEQCKQIDPKGESDCPIECQTNCEQGYHYYAAKSNTNTN